MPGHHRTANRYLPRPLENPALAEKPVFAIEDLFDVHDHAG